ncbi:lysophosphatidylserine lipase ABHD12-like [Paramacrobiotus metropolitanus]|uniref:lysophosphatidylserine lipase ABHD12-like n=1 Tax=Paramacrobiotus metropolitanus TaxID=2943436 RepID=UPI0024464C09|nr:lysophosphatidylserine lipase ABHD12-like [Paramacrobiotus metropolitanus]
MAFSSYSPHSFAKDISILLTKILLGFATFVLSVGLIFGFLFKFHPSSVGWVIFMNHIHFPPFRNFSDLAVYNLQGENFFLDNGPVALGVWHLTEDAATPFVFEKQAQWTERPVVMYIHGAQGSRAAYHRIQMYQLLRRMGCPVVTFDYRGYGDSSGVPTSELDLLDDASAVYRWAVKKYPNRPIFFWGHSLGTGVSVRLVQTLEAASSRISGLILDSPYSSMFDVMRSSPLLFPFHQVPAFTEILLDALEEVHMTLNSSERVQHTRVPLLILHAEDDWVIPVSLGRKLYDVAKQRGANVVTEFVEYSREFKYGHRGIYRDPNLPVIVADFMSRSLEWRDSPQSFEVDIEPQT